MKRTKILIDLFYAYKSDNLNRQANQLKLGTTISRNYADMHKYASWVHQSDAYKKCLIVLYHKSDVPYWRIENVD